jgi:hypothetical protein
MYIYMSYVSTKIRNRKNEIFKSTPRTDNAKEKLEIEIRGRLDLKNIGKICALMGY